MKTNLTHLLWLLALCAAFKTAHSSVINYHAYCEQQLTFHPTFQSPQNHFKLIHSIEGHTGIHLTYTHYFQNIEVLESTIEFIFLKHVDRVIVYDDLHPAVELKSHPFEPDLRIHLGANGFEYVLQKYTQGPYSTEDSISYIAVNTGEVVQSISCRIYFHAPDTTIKIPVFKPNPIESSQGRYGNLFVDDNDRSTTTLNNQLNDEFVSFEPFKNKFIPNHRWIKFGEVTSPFDSSFIVEFNGAPFNRSHPAFEALNSAYHLNYVMQFLAQIGHETLLDTILVDPHALNRADQSAFNGHVSPPTLEFGQGGVDDAEDGHVVMHEFVHAISHNAKPFTYSGLERTAMEEGYADYLAAAVGQLQSGNATSRIFTWDGHNEFWNGFVLNGDWKYQDINGSQSVGRELWSSCLTCIEAQLGLDKTVKLVLEQLYYQRRNTTMKEMAENLLFLDTLMNLALNYHSIKNCFIQKGVLSGDHRDAFAKKDGPLQMKVLNSRALNNPNQLTVCLNREADFSIYLYDNTGRMVYTRRQTGGFISLENLAIVSGIYILQVQTHPKGSEPPIQLIQRIVY